MKAEAIMPLSVIDTNAGDVEIGVTFDFHPGQSPSGISGPPENYDPGSGPEYEDVRIEGREVSAEQEEKIIEWLDAHWEPPEPDWPEPDDHFNPKEID